MDEGLVDILKPLSVLVPAIIMVVLFLKTLTDYFLKKKIVDSGLDREEVSELLRQKEESKYSALKWGLIILFGGIGLLLLSVIPYDPNSTFPFGVMAVSLSTGFLLFYFLVKKEKGN